MGVEVKDPSLRRLPVGLGLVVAGLVGGIQADQVVHPVAARNLLLDERDPLQGPQQRPGLAGGQGGQAGGGGQADVRARGNAQQPEDPRLLRGEGVVGPGQHGGQTGRRRVLVQGTEPGTGIT